MSESCKKCDEEMYRISGVCTDRDGIREDMYCIACDTRYGVRSHGLVILSEGTIYAKVNIKNRELRTTISTLANELVRAQRKTAGYKKLVDALKDTS